MLLRCRNGMQRDLAREVKRCFEENAPIVEFVATCTSRRERPGITTGILGAIGDLCRLAKDHDIVIYYYSQWQPLRQRENNIRFLLRSPRFTRCSINDNVVLYEDRHKIVFLREGPRLYWSIRDEESAKRDQIREALVRTSLPRDIVNIIAEFAIIKRDSFVFFDDAMLKPHYYKTRRAIFTSREYVT